MTRRPNRSRASRSSRSTARRYCARRGARNFGSSRRRSSPANVVAGIDPPGQQAAAQRAVGQHRDAVLAAIRQHVRLDRALEQIVRRLRRMQRRGRAKHVHLGRIEVAHADRVDLAGAIEPRQRLGGVVDRHQRIGPVHLVEVDRVDAQPAQRRLRFLDDALRAAVAKRAAVVPAEPGLGGDDGALALAVLRQRPADDLLGAAEAVHRRGVDQRDAVIERRMNGADRVRLVAAAPHPAADRPGAEPDARHGDRRQQLLHLDSRSSGLHVHGAASFSRM